MIGVQVITLSDNQEYGSACCYGAMASDGQAASVTPYSETTTSTTTKKSKTTTAIDNDEAVFQRLLKACDAQGWSRKRQRVVGSEAVRADGQPPHHQHQSPAWSTVVLPPTSSLDHNHFHYSHRSLHQHLPHRPLANGGVVYEREQPGER